MLLPIYKLKRIKGESTPGGGGTFSPLLPAWLSTTCELIMRRAEDKIGKQSPRTYSQITECPGQDFSACTVSSSANSSPWAAKKYAAPMTRSWRTPPG
jgi:hypothetical protein